jgi:hypothetical protein
MKVPAYWPMIKAGLPKCSEEFARFTEEELNNVLISLLGLESQLWVAFDNDKPEEPFGFIITYIANNLIDKAKTLWVYALITEHNTDRQEWYIGFERLKFYAEQNKCKQIMAYTNNEFIKLVTRTYMPVRYHVIATYL